MTLRILLYMLSAETRFRQTSNISRTFAGNNIVDHSDGVGAAPAPATSSLSI